MKYIFLFLLIALIPGASSYASLADSAYTAMPELKGKTPIDNSFLELTNSGTFITRDSLSASPVIRKDIDPFDTGMNFTLLGGLGAAFVGSGAVIHNYMKNAWWTEHEKFYFSIDYWSKLSNFNKFNHFYSVNLLGHLFSGAFEASGMQALGSTWYSSLSALAYMSYIEIENGSHKNNGFSVSNFSAGILGTAFYIGQYYVPEMKSFMPKVSYKPAGSLKDKNRIIFDDYSAQKYWMSVRVKDFLPEKVSGFWPSFLMLAAGTGLRSNGNEGNYNPMEFYIALDLDAEKLPLYGPFWQFVKNTLNYVHFPMPGLRVAPGSAFFIFCF